MTVESWWVLLFRRKAGDAWSGKVAVAALLLALCFVIAISANFVLVFFLVPALALILLAALFWLCFDIVEGRLRHAISIVASLAIALTIIRHAWFIRECMDDFVFFMHRQDYERQVEHYRAEKKDGRPIQIVLLCDDRSPFVSINVFYYIIYDETDNFKLPKNGDVFLPFPGSDSGQIEIMTPGTLHHLTGHYYSYIYED